MTVIYFGLQIRFYKVGFTKPVHLCEQLDQPAAHANNRTSRRLAYTLAITQNFNQLTRTTGPAGALWRIFTGTCCSTVLNIILCFWFILLIRISTSCCAWAFIKSHCCNTLYWCRIAKNMRGGWCLCSCLPYTIYHKRTCCRS